MMTYHFNMKTLTIILALALTGCSALQDRRDDLLKPPNVLDQLYCEGENMTLCSGFLTQKDLIKEK